MSSLKGKSISSTYKNLLQTSVELTDGKLKDVETGDGNITSLKISTDNFIARLFPEPLCICFKLVSEISLDD